jgi:hypothetical protein
MGRMMTCVRAASFLAGGSASLSPVWERAVRAQQQGDRQDGRQGRTPPPPASQGSNNGPAEAMAHNVCFGTPDHSLNFPAPGKGQKPPELPNNIQFRSKNVNL